MGTYCTTTSLEQQMIGVSFDQATTFLAVRCITRAENEINKYLAQRYDTSVFMATSTSVPPLVRSWCEDLAMAYIYRRSSRGGKEWLALAKEMISDIRDNMKMVIDHKADLVNTAGSIIDDASDRGDRVLSTTEDYSNTFNEDEPLNWEVDQDKLDDIESERS